MGMGYICIFMKNKNSTHKWLLRIETDLKFQ